MLVFRDFFPSEPELQLVIQSGALIFRTQSGGLMICRQVLQGATPLALIERITWQKDLALLLEAAETWQQGNYLETLLLIIQNSKEVSVLRELGYQVKTVTATVAIKKGTSQLLKGESIYVSYPTSESPVQEIPQQSDAKDQRERDGVALRRTYPPGKGGRPTLNISAKRGRGRSTRDLPTGTELPGSPESVES